jgi:parallel beta-helix repeat protein
LILQYKILESFEFSITSHRIRFELSKKRVWAAAISLDEEAIVIPRETRVIVRSNNPSATLAELKSRDIRIEKTYGNFIRILMPVSGIEDMIKIQSIDRIKLPERLVQYTLKSEGLPLMRIPSWHDLNFTGTGVKIAIIDGGFLGYDALVGIELPSASTVRSFNSKGIYAGSDHGTACAEIVHDIAPDAHLYLVNFNDHLDLGEAVDWLIDEGIDIISFSVGYYGGPDNGNGVYDSIVDKARNNGILWVSAAGNDGQSHWKGAWKDDDGDHLLNFIPADESITLATSTDIEDLKAIKAYLKWDDPWGTSNNDYDLYLYYQNTVVAKSEIRQNGHGDPIESIVYLPEPGRFYNLYVKEVSSHRPVNFHVFVPNYGLERWVEEESIVSPACARGAFTVGAVSARPPIRLEPYSSRGPTVDGRIKPDIMAPARVTTKTYETQDYGFSGTSASAPHVAGAAALVKQRFPEYTPQNIQNFLENLALDLGLPGKDNEYGSGLVSINQPRTWFVDNDLQENPNADFSKIQNALDTAIPGDTIIVHDGYYQENLELNKPVSVVGRSTVPNGVNIDRNEAGTTVVKINSPNCTLEGFNIANTLGNSTAGLEYGIWLKGSNYNLIKDNIVQNCYTGIYLMDLDIPAGSNNNFKSNTLRNNGCSGCGWPTPNLSIQSSLKNFVWHNIFLKKVRLHAWDEYGNSFWDDGTRGNYWESFADKDLDNNGIWDTFYPIPGDSQQNSLDNFPMVQQEMLTLRKGDLNSNTLAGLDDAILSLQIAGGLNPADVCLSCIPSKVDIGGNNAVGLEEAIYPLKSLVARPN